MSPTLKPTRVLLNVEGEAVSADRALERGVGWDIILIRNDGWSLGASCALAPVADSLWSADWVAVIENDRIRQY